MTPTPDLDGAARTADERMERVVNLIARGEWGPFHARRLADEWGVSVATVNRLARQAIAALAT
jgi:hypothetical protein